MQYQSDFLEGKQYWSEVRSSYRYTENRQLGMFMDRPDLWPVARKKRRASQHIPGQPSLFQIEGKEVI